MFNNTDYPALIIAVVALISPVMVEFVRQCYNKEQRKEENDRRDKERNSDFERQDNQRRDEQEFEINKQKEQLKKEKLLNQQKLLLNYDIRVKEFYEFLLLDENQKRRLGEQKNKIIDLFNKILIEFNFVDRWKYSKDEITIDTIESELKQLGELETFTLFFLNITDCIQNTVQQFCDDEDFDEIPLLKLYIELYQILLPILFQSEDKKNIETPSEHLNKCIERYKTQEKEREKNKGFLIKDYPSVSNYFETIFKKNNIFDFVMKKLEDEDVNQYRRIHKSIDDKNDKNYVEIKVQGKSFHINKNCNRDVAERFILDILKEMETN